MSRFYNVTSQYEGQEPVTQRTAMNQIPATLSILLALSESRVGAPAKLILEAVPVTEDDPDGELVATRVAEAQKLSEDAVLAFADVGGFESLSTLVQEVICASREDEHLEGETCRAVSVELETLGEALAAAGQDAYSVNVSRVGLVLQRIAKRLEAAAKLGARLRKIQEHEHTLMIARGMEKMKAKEAASGT